MCLMIYLVIQTQKRTKRLFSRGWGSSNQLIIDLTECTCLESWKLKSLKVTKWRKDEGRMKEEWWRMIQDKWRKMKDEGWMKMISSCWGVLLMDRRTDICDCRVAFATENECKMMKWISWLIKIVSAQNLLHYYSIC